MLFLSQDPVRETTLHLVSRLLTLLLAVTVLETFLLVFNDLNNLDGYWLLDYSAKCPSVGTCLRFFS